MLIISGHGVESTRYPGYQRPLSYMQYMILESKKPIRICGAPTGAGKTFAFIEWVENTKGWVLFLVPTQALGANIKEQANSNGIKSVVWDGSQSEVCHSRGELVWEVRGQELRNIKNQGQGGLVITTPETIGQLFLETPQKKRIVGMDVYALLDAGHWVIDEVHTYNERGLGFIHLLMTLIAGRWQLNKSTPHLTFLSATHSNLLNGLISTDTDAHVPSSMVDYIDEKIASPDSLENGRWLHGDVKITFTEGSMASAVNNYLPMFLSRHQRVIVIFDSLKEWSQMASDFYQSLQVFGLHSSEVFLVNGQDRQIGKSADGVGFEAGIKPFPHHRVIIGTSAIEIGVTYSDGTAMIMNVGFNAASFLQRVGRVARGNVAGEVIVVLSSNKETPVFHDALMQMDGQTLAIEEIRQQLSPMLSLNLDRARALGSAYWSMLRKEKSPVYDAVRILHDQLSSAKQPGAQLNQLWAQSNLLNKIQKNKYQKWLESINNSLMDIRGFTPSVRLKFADFPPFDYSREWADRYLNDNFHIELVTYPDHEEWIRIYDCVRSEALMDYPQTIAIKVMLPDGKKATIEIPPGRNGMTNGFNEYIRKSEIPLMRIGNPVLMKATLGFLRSTLLMVPVSEDEAGMMNAKSGVL